ncbi:MAG: hypothetical protein CSA36_03885 [Draconibacterium sp.]|nr:MAG: hypothetical protein CSA36_03885 [Draconibacterium sp.]
MRNILKSTTFLAILSCWLWSTAFAGVKIGLQYNTPFQFAGIRFFVAGFILFIFLGHPRRYISEIKNSARFILIIALVQVFVQYALFYSGMNIVPGALGAMIIGSSPLFIAIVAHFSFHNDRLSPLKVASILIGVAGIVVITLGRASTISMGGFTELTGIFLLLINNLVSGYSNVLIAKSKHLVSPIVLSSSSLMIGGLLLFLISLPLEGLNTGPFPTKYYLALGWLSFLSAAAITIWYGLLQRPGVKVSILNTWKFLIPVSGAILSWLLIKEEKPDVISFAGMAIIAISLLLLNYANRKISKNTR